MRNFDRLLVSLLYKTPCLFNRLTTASIIYNVKFDFIVLMFLNIPVNSYGHAGTVTSYFVGLLPYIEMNETSSPAIQHQPSIQLRLTCRNSPTEPLFLGRPQSVSSLALRHLTTRQFFQARMGVGQQSEGELSSQ